MRAKHLFFLLLSISIGFATTPSIASATSAQMVIGVLQTIAQFGSSPAGNSAKKATGKEDSKYFDVAQRAEEIRNFVNQRAAEKGMRIYLEKLTRTNILKNTILYHYDGREDGKKAVYVFANGKNGNGMVGWVENSEKDLNEYNRLSLNELAQKLKSYLSSDDLDMLKSQNPEIIVKTP